MQNEAPFGGTPQIRTWKPSLALDLFTLDDSNCILINRRLVKPHVNRNLSYQAACVLSEVEIVTRHAQKLY